MVNVSGKVRESLQQGHSVLSPEVLHDVISFSIFSKVRRVVHTVKALQTLQTHPGADYCFPRIKELRGVC